MKKMVSILFVSFLITICFVFAQCKKSNSSSSGLNITLYDKDTTTIKNYIQGKWRVHYYYGGICGTCKQDMEMYNDYFEFNYNNKIVFTFQNLITADTTYQFTMYQQSSSDYIHKTMRFFNKNGTPYSLEVNKLKDDTLILAVPFINNPDYFSIFLTKSQ